MNIKRHIPNTITLGNLFCGCLAIVKVVEGNMVWTAYLVGMALVLDFFDGFAARLLQVSSAIGKDLDSLADMVTFGLVPGLVMFKMIGAAHIAEIADPTTTPDMIAIAKQSQVYLPQYAGFLITLFSGLRLAKFNNDIRQSLSFIGLPTPANAAIICSFPLIINFQPELVLMNNLIHQVPFLLGVTIFLSYLLNAEIPLFALKFKNYSWAENKLVYLFLMGALLLILSLKFIAIPLIILFYILLSIVNNIFLKNKV